MTKLCIKIHMKSGSAIESAFSLFHGSQYLIAGPVSYTHLDVYKRQSVPWAGIADWSRRVVANRQVLLEKLLLLDLHLDDRVIAVSYTHLDVYKRQGIR